MKIIKAIILSSLLMASYANATCSVMVDDFSFGAIILGNNSSENTSGSIVVTCTPEDIGKNIKFMIDKDYVSLVGDDNKKIPLEITIQGEPLLVNIEKSLVIREATTYFSIFMNLKTLQLPVTPTIGKYNNLTTLSWEIL